MKTYTNLWAHLCTFEHLRKAYGQARKHKLGNPNVLAFAKNWRLHLCTLLRELRTNAYKPLPLRTFVLRDPKTRVICVSDFRDRIVHHALVNVLQPVFEPRFIYDSYASRKGKGTLPALQRFDAFLHKVTRNGRRVPGARNANAVQAYALKADIRHYFDTVDHEILLGIIRRRIKDDSILRLMKTVLNNYDAGTPGKGMPLGNWTSQFLANVYLNELDQFIKHELKAAYYLRYVDDFVILHRSRAVLREYERSIRVFLQQHLKLDLHPDKSRIIPLGRGVSLLGFRTFYHYKLVRQRNLRSIRARLAELLEEHTSGRMTAEGVLEALRGWNAYAIHGNTYRLRQQLAASVTRGLEPRWASYPCEDFASPRSQAELL